jgi:formate C-acetyltransferase
MKRLEALRCTAMKHTHSNDEFYYRFYKRYHKNKGMEEYARYADAFAAAFKELTPVITPDELIVGAIENTLSDAEKADWENVYRPVAQERARRAGPGQDSHMAIDYPLLLSKGILGIVSRIDALCEQANAEQREFYLAARECLLSVIALSERYAAQAEAMAQEEQDDARRAELLEIARICKKVPAKPADSFYEAVQSVHFISFCLSLNPLRLCHQQFQLGHPDRYLLPYYENDVRRGVLSRERAQLLLDCLGVQINVRVPSGLSSGYMVGGRDRDGRLVANDLTEMLMQVVDDIRMVYPAVGLCYTSEMPDAILTQACELLAKGRSHPAIFNDDVISRGLERYGVPADEAHDYIHSTCVEITPVSSSNVWVASPYTNMAQLLLDTLNEEHSDFDALLQALLARLDQVIEKNFQTQNEFRRIRAENSLNPLLSCFVDDCLARGVDIEKGGARYNWIMPSFVGMANLVDSLYALRTLVYERRELTVSELCTCLANDFVGHEALLARVNALPKYGNNVDEVDELFTGLIDHIVKECQKYTPMHANGRLIPSVFCWVMHEMFGRETGATPDGRRAGFPLGDGSGPCQGREKKGPTASILSSTKWEHCDLIGGVAVNMKFSRSSMGSDSIDVMKSLVRAYMTRGGFEMQINVIDRALLECAQKDPEAYSDLVVRIGGYSDYFTRLSTQMQAEVILRTEHRI